MSINKLLNPFTYGKPIQDPARFFGREQIVNQIFNHLKADQDVSLVGERRIGKTSLLKYISDPEVIKKQSGWDPRNSFFVYLDLQGFVRDPTPEHFWRETLKSLTDRMDEMGQDARLQKFVTRQDPDPAGFRHVLEEMQGHGKNVILLLDEIETAANQEQFGPDFFDELRFLAGHKALTIVTACYCEWKDLKVGNFFNYFTNITLKCFSRPAAEELIERSLQGMPSDCRFTPEEKELAFCYSGLHPFFLQMICSFLYQNLQLNPDLSERLETAKKQFADEAARHFLYYFEQSSDDEKHVLQSLAAQAKKMNARTEGITLKQIEKNGNSCKAAVKKLVWRCLVSEEKGHYAIFSPVFAEWIQENNPLPESGLFAVTNRTKLWMWARIGLAAAVLLGIALMFLFIPGLYSYLNNLTTSIGQYFDSTQNKFVGILAVVVLPLMIILVLIGKPKLAIALWRWVRKFIV